MPAATLATVGSVDPARRREAGDHRQAKAALFDVLAGAAAGLAAGRRVEIVDVLAQGERSVEDLAGEIGQSVANTSHHLRALARAGLVRSQRRGTRIFYALAGPEVEDLWAALRRVAEVVRDDLGRHAEDYLGESGGVEEVSRAELAERLAAGTVTVIDVRPVAEFRAGHVPGARSVPLDQLAAAVESLPPGLAVVAYCRGPYCRFAHAAVRALRTRGIEAARLEDGFPEWRRAGLPVAVGDAPGRLGSGSAARRRAAAARTTR